MTRDNPFVSATPARRLAPSLRVTLGRLLEGELSVEDWLHTTEASRLRKRVRIGCVPRDVQLVMLDDAPTVGAESVHAFLHAPLFWWLVSILWCISAGPRFDRQLGSHIKGYRLHPRFVEDPAHYGAMFGNRNDAYEDWSSFASTIAAESTTTLAASTVDLKDFYYSIVATPSRIVLSFVASLDESPKVPRNVKVLTRLLDALHAQFAARHAELKARGPAIQDALPLPVGLPSSQLLANLVMSQVVADLEESPDIAAVSAYADDLMVVSPTLPAMGEETVDYLARLNVVDAQTRQIRSPRASLLAMLSVRLEKSATFFVRATPSDEEGVSLIEDAPQLDPYLETEPGPEWGGRLTTVLRAPYKRDRVPRELATQIRRLVDEIRIGLAPAEAQGRVISLVDELDDAAFLALRPYWTDLLVAAIAAIGTEAVAMLTFVFTRVVRSLEPPVDANAPTRSALYFGLRASWTQALAQALAVSLSEDEREGLIAETPWLIVDGPLDQLSTAEVVGYAQRMRERRIVDAAFVAVPLAEFTDWPGRLIGGDALGGFLEWRDGDPSPPTAEALANALAGAVRFIPLHEVCVALHMWAGVQRDDWLDVAFAILEAQPLVDTLAIADLHERAQLALDPPKATVPEDEDERAQLLLRFAMPSVMVAGNQLDALISSDRTTLGKVAARSRSNILHLVLEAAKRRADVLVLPEWAVLPEMLLWLMERSAQGQMFVVAGQAPLLRAGRYQNALWTGLPLRDVFGHQACLVPPPRQKRFLSPHERGPLKAAGIEEEAASAFVPSYRWRGLTFASLLCFEFADISTRQALRATADVMTVSSWNRDWRYFDAIQESVTRDNYCLTVCVNTGAYPGTRIMRPTVSAKSLVASVHGSDDPALVTRVIDMLPIFAARIKGKGPSEFLEHEPADDAVLKDYKPVPPL